MTERKYTIPTAAGPVQVQLVARGHVEYRGGVAALVASGALTDRMIAIRKARSPNDAHPLLDEHGRPFRIHGFYSYKTGAWKDGTATVRLWRQADPDSAALPGVAELLEQPASTPPLAQAPVASPGSERGNVVDLAPRRWMKILKADAQPVADVVDLLRDLLAQAERGELSGLIACALRSPLGQGRVTKKYGCSVAGVARENPQTALAVMDVCHLLLREIALKDAGID